jgi:bifunctional non-homologous end joining protein LigD
MRLTTRRKMEARVHGTSNPIRSAPRAPLPDFIPPQLAILVDEPPAGGAWLHEIKLDGYKTAARLNLVRSGCSPARG